MGDIIDLHERLKDLEEQVELINEKIFEDENHEDNESDGLEEDKTDNSEKFEL